MADPTLELQGAIVARLKSQSYVTALIGARVFDPVPRDQSGGVTADFPYVSIGPTNEIADDADCINGSEITFQLDAWSREPSFVEVRKVANAVRRALTDYDFTLSTNALVSFEFAGIRTLRDPDGKTAHAVIEFTALVEASLT